MSKQFTGEITETDISKIAGNNYFELSTGNAIIKGILTELPAFGLSAKWENAPIGDLGNKIQEFFCGDLMKAVSYAFGNSDYKNQILIDKWTQRMFVGTENKDISLKWRVYSNNSLGQTGAKNVISYLSSYAAINSDNTLKMRDLGANIKKTLESAYNQGQAAAEYINQIFGADAERSDDAKKAWLKTANAWFNQHRQKVLQEVKADYLGTEENPSSELMNTYTTYNPRDTQGFKDAEKNRAQAIENKKKAINTLEIDINDFPIAEDDLLDSSEYKISHVVFLDEYGDDPGEGSSVEIFDTKELKIQADKILEAFNEDNAWKTACEKGMIERLVKEYVNRLNNGMANAAGGRDAKSEALSSQGELYKQAIGTINGLGKEYIGDDRVDKAVNLGARLWRLSLYTFIYKKPLVVLVNSWTCTPSKEMFGTNHVYYDFEVSCKLDQIASSEKWSQIFNAASSTNQQTNNASAPSGTNASGTPAAGTKPTTK